MFVRPGLPLTLVFTPKRGRLSSRVVSRPFPMIFSLSLGGCPRCPKRCAAPPLVLTLTRLAGWKFGLTVACGETVHPATRNTGYPCCRIKILSEVCTLLRLNLHGLARLLYRAWLPVAACHPSGAAPRARPVWVPARAGFRTERRGRVWPAWLSPQ